MSFDRIKIDNENIRVTKLSITFIKCDVSFLYLEHHSTQISRSEQNLERKRVLNKILKITISSLFYCRHSNTRRKIIHVHWNVYNRKERKC